MDSPEVANEQHAPSLLVAIAQWGGCLATLILLVGLASSFNSVMLDNLVFIFYLVAGFYLSRAVLRRVVEWHPTYSTLYNVTSAKFNYFLFWPIAYVFLFVRLAINKVL